MANWDKLNKEFDDCLNNMSDEEFRAWANKLKPMSEEKKVLCGFCNQPIHINDFGGVQKDIGFFHSECYLKSEYEKLIST